MPGPGTFTSNLLLNGNFSAHGRDWVTLNTVDYSRQYCRVLNGQASQVVNVTPGATYTLRLWTQVLFQGRGELFIRPNPPAADERIALNDFHVWTWRTIIYTPPAGTIFITVAIAGTAGEVCVDELELLADARISKAGAEQNR